MKYVHVISPRFEGGAMVPETVLTAILEDGSPTRMEGDAKLIARLEKGIYSPLSDKIVSPSDGEVFLQALGMEFRGAHLFATPVLSGASVEPYRMPPMAKAA